MCECSGDGPSTFGGSPSIVRASVKSGPHVSNVCKVGGLHYVLTGISA